MKVEIMDTTLRDGEQTPGIAFTEREKVNLAKMLLEEVQVDRIEVGSAKISKGELESVKMITDWAKQKGYLDKIEVLGFVDGRKSVDWLVHAGGRVLNLLCKGSLNHLKNQLRKSEDEHITDIKEVISYAKDKGVNINLYLEDWSNGMKDSPKYVDKLLNELKNTGIQRVMLTDTLGILDPETTHQYVRRVVEEHKEIHFDFHAHNDYDLATANSYMAVKAGACGIHTTVNGLGERAGNTTLSSIVGVLRDHDETIQIKVNEKKLSKISKIVEAFSGIRIATNKPIIGEHVFTQTCGVHADGDNKGNLYHNKLVPERFGRSRKYALGKTSGKANIAKNLEELGIVLDKEAIQKITEKVVELGDRKESITTEDLPYIIADVLGNNIIEEKIKMRNYYICHAQALSPVATISMEIEGMVYEETAVGAGQYDAFMNALSKIYKKLERQIPKLVDYKVTIPPGGQTSALVETVITWRQDKEFTTKGLDSDQTAAAIKATMKMLNIIEN